MPYIIHYYNGSPINHFVLEKKLTIGRGHDNDIQIDDPTVSVKHAVIEYNFGSYCQIRDLNSTNGVLYKGKKVTVQSLEEGDTVVLGTHDMKYVSQLPERLEQTRKIKKSWIPGVYYTEE